ncbi:MAG: peptidylprolyl isomerase [Treponemataceae bacterium]|nr:MAG: peptidylprolyl isomerase [Treponemataceae bacterium]
MKNSVFMLFLPLLILMHTQFFAQDKGKENGRKTMNDFGDGVFAVIATAKGEIVVRLEAEKTPLTVTNFAALAEGTMTGKPFYDGLTFHRVIPDFMIQGGDPSGNGSGGPGYTFPDEFDASLKHDRAGVLSMANRGAGTNGSQFFITHIATPWLDGKHTVFGYVVSGQEVVNKIAGGDVMQSVTIVRKGDAALKFVADKAHFDDLLEKRVAAARQAGLDARAADLAKITALLGSDAQKTETGIFYKITKPSANGVKPVRGKKAKIKYRLSLLDGRVLDSSDNSGGSFEFSVGSGEVIAGFDRMVLDMATGEKRTAVIPPELGYGATGVGGVIPPNAFLVFDLELISIR